MTVDTADRIETLLDQLGDPTLTHSEIEKIQKKLSILKDLN